MTRYGAVAVSPGSKFTIESSRVHIIGAFVMISFVAIANEAFGNSDVVATVQDGYRPERNTPFALMTLYRGTTILPFANSGSVDANGNVYEGFTSAGGQAGDKLAFIGAYSLA